MTLRRRYHASDTGPFGQLVRIRELAGFSLEPAAPREVWDLFADTPEATLLKRGLTLRLRKHDGVMTGSLRAGDGGEEIATARWSDDRVLNGVPDIPEGPLAMAVRHEIGDAALVALLRFHQYRTPRAFFRGDQLAGVLSLDVVADQTNPTDHVVSSEVEIELTGAGSDEDLTAIDELLQRLGFIPDPYSKFERGIIRLGADANRTLLLLPSERLALEAARDGGSGVARRRAEVVLLGAEGVSEDEISRNVGLAPARVAHWLEGFRTRRMKAMDEAAPDPTTISDAESPEVATYRVSEVVGTTGASFHIERDEPPREYQRVMSVLRPGATADESLTEAVHPPTTEPPPEREPFPDFTDVQGEVEEVAPQESDVAESEDVLDPDEATPDSQDESVRNPFHELIAQVGLEPDLSVSAAIRRLTDWVEDEIANLSEMPEGTFERSALERARALSQAAELVGALWSRAQGVATPSLQERLDGYRRVVRAALSLERSRRELVPPGEGEPPPIAVALALTVWAVDLRRILQELTPAGEDLRDALQALRREVDEQAERGDDTALSAILPELLWERLRRLRTVTAQDAIPAQLPELEERNDAILFVLALFPDTQTRKVAAPLVDLRGRIGDVTAHADLALQLDGFVSDWIVPGAAADPMPLQSRLAAAEEAAVNALARLDSVLTTLASIEFRRGVGEVAASV